MLNFSEVNGTDWAAWSLTPQMRADLFGQLSEIPALDIVGMNSITLCSLLLYGCSQLGNITGRMILDSSISYIKKTKRFQ